MACFYIGSSDAATDERGSSCQQSGFGAVCSPRAKFHDSATARRRYDASRLACDHRLKIYGREKKGFDDLGFDDWSSNSQHRLHPERRGALGHCPHIARKSEFRQVLEELARYLLEGRMFAQIIDVSVTKSQRRKIVERLLESGDNQVSSMPGKPAGE